MFTLTHLSDPHLAPLPKPHWSELLSKRVTGYINWQRRRRFIHDADVLALAVAAQRIVVTLNRRHFIRLHHTTPTHAGMVVCTFDPDFAALAQRIHSALEAQPQMAGQLVRVNRPAV